MSYTESSNVITISDALPMTDDSGKAQTNYFDFSVTSNMTLNSNDPNGSVNYDIELELLESDSGYNTLSNNQVKVYLEDITNGVVSVVEPTLVNDLTTSTTGKIIYSTSHAHSSNIETITTNYRLRAWIDMNVSADNFSTTSYEYKFRVNVVGEASALSRPKIASVNANNLTVTASISSETEIKSFGFSEDENTEPTTWIDASNHLTEVSNNNEKYNINKLTNNGLKQLSTSHNYSLTYSFENAGEYYLWLKDKLNNVVSYDEPFILENFYNSLIKNVNTSVIPNFNYISNYNTNGINVNDNGLFLYNGTDDNNGDKDIYYYRGNVTNNNVLFGGYCWKIIRTTSTGGVKMIYNGAQKTEYANLEKIEHDDYLNLTNSSSSPFTFDETTNKWTSGVIGNSSSTEISFTVSGNDTYILEYDISSEAGGDKVYVYKDNVNIKTVSGIEKGQVDLGVLTSSNIIKIKYSKDGSTVVGRDNVVFSLNKKNSSSTSYMTCDNKGTTTQMANTLFNSNALSPADVGYMYGERYMVSTKTMTSIEDIYYYGNDVTYSDGTYTLTDTVASTGSNWSTDRKTLANGKHYTCFSTSTTCTTVYYITYFGDSTIAWYLTFTDGDNLDTAKEKMYTNTNSSKVKIAVDNWYKTYLSSYSNYLENTIFCNERTLYSGPLYSKDANSTGSSLYKTYQKLQNGLPSLTCLNNNDKFSLSIENGGTESYGNNALTYPIGLITADELSIAGAKYGQIYTDFYLSSNTHYWSLSPYYWGYRTSDVFYLHSPGKIITDYVIGDRNGYLGYGARGVISLKYGTVISSGDGSYTNPYVVKTN